MANQLNNVSINGLTIEDRDYLVQLRDSGEINMYGATIYLQREFGYTAEVAKEKLIKWMEEK